MVLEVNKENGLERLISFEEASLRLKNFYGRDVSYALKDGLMQTSFFYYEMQE